LNTPHQARPPAGGSAILRPSLHQLAEQFALLRANTADGEQLLLEFLQLAIGIMNAAGAIYFTAEKNNLVPARELLSRQAQTWSPDIAADLLKNAQEAMAGGRIHHAPLASSPSVFLVSCPLTGTDAPAGCLTFVILVGAQAIESFLVIVQLLAALLTSYLGSKRPEATQVGALFLPLVDILAAALSAPDGAEALVLLNSRLRQWAGCSQVAIGVSGSNGVMTLRSFSDITSTDGRTELSRALLKGLNECAIQQEMLCWPRTDGPSGFHSPVFQELVTSTHNRQAVGLAITGTGDKVAGALILLWTEVAPRHECVEALQRAHALLGACLGVWRGRAEGGFKAKARKKMAEKFGRFTGLQVVSCAAVVLVGLLLLPVPFLIRSECLVRPVVTRFVVARFDGILQEVIVQPGDTVSAGQLLARLDGRETELEVASLQAERDKAGKTRDVHMAIGDTAAAQVARLDEQRFQEKIDLLDEKRKAIVLSSPVDGIVLTGDLKRNQGSPVSRGQALFEVAPLETMTIELNVPESDIVYLETGMPVKAAFDACPGRSWRGGVQRISPKSQIAGNRNVFVAGLDVANPEGRLRPGMHGTARVDAGWRPLGWIVFRKPFTALQRLVDLIF
jgi:multidrug resistance efflux pump